MTDEWVDVAPGMLSLGEVASYQPKSLDELLPYIPMRQEDDGSWFVLVRFKGGGVLELWYDTPNGGLLRYKAPNVRFERSGRDIRVSSIDAS